MSTIIIARTISSIILSIMGLFSINRIIKSTAKLLNIKNTILIGFLIILPVVIYNIEYNYMYTIIVYIMMMVTYKYILNISFIKSIILCAILLLFMSVFDLITVGILIIFVSLQEIRTVWYLNVISSTISSLFVFIVFSIPSVKIWINNFVNSIETKRFPKFIIFFVLVIIAISTILYTISLNCKLNNIFSTNFLILIIVFLLSIILIEERNKYEKLYQQYDGLFEYVKIFEEWIEKEQFTRHEYKNQLAVLRCMTKEKKVKDKIDSIITDYINVDDEMINELRMLPNGGLKGLLYYKIIVANNNKLNLEVDVSNKVNKQFKKLSQSKIEVLSKILGVYLDNAIEASSTSKKKLISLEIYVSNNDIVFIISNTFNPNNIVHNRNQKGSSSKGPGRGNGLYFATKLLQKNNWIDETQTISKDFYIEKIIIKTAKDTSDKNILRKY